MNEKTPLAVRGGNFPGRPLLWLTYNQSRSENSVLFVKFSLPAIVVCKGILPSQGGEAVGTLHQGEPWYDEAVSGPYEAEDSCKCWPTHLWRDVNAQRDIIKKKEDKHMFGCFSACVLVWLSVCMNLFHAWDAVAAAADTHARCSCACGLNGVIQAYFVPCYRTIGPLLNNQRWISISTPGLACLMTTLLNST